MNNLTPPLCFSKMTRDIFALHAFEILVESHSAGAPMLNLRLTVQRIVPGIGETLIKDAFGIRLCGHVSTYIFTFWPLITDKLKHADTPEEI